MQQAIGVPWRDWRFVVSVILTAPLLAAVMTSGVVAGQPVPEMLIDLRTGSGNSVPQNLTVSPAGDWMYFSASGDDGTGLWRTDGTAQGTELVRGGLLIHEIIVTDDGRLFLSARENTLGHELWTSDGTEAGTRLVKDIHPGFFSSQPTHLTALDHRVIFIANDGVHGQEPWISDGTEEGTFLLSDVNPGGAHSSLGQFVVMPSPSGPLAFFQPTVHDPDAFQNNSFPLWRSDGTVEGTIALRENPADPKNGPQHTTVYQGNGVYWDDALWFLGWDVSLSSSPELWMWSSTGNENPGTDRAFPLVHRSISQSDIPQLMLTLVFVGPDHALFAMHDSWSSSYRSLWVTDFDGALLLREFSGFETRVRPLYSSALGMTFFRAVEPATGWELWRTDGSAIGTALVRDLAPGSASSNPHGLIEYRDRVYFIADDGEHGREIWETDGSEDGTRMVHDILPGSGSSINWPLEAVRFQVFKDKLFFPANDGIHGTELWVLDTRPSEVIFRDRFE